MTVIGEILQNISNFILSQPEWEDTPIYYHKGEVNPSIEFPCIVIEPQEILSEDNGCSVDSVRDIEISLYMNEADARIALNKVWKFEEDILSKFKDKFFTRTLHNNLVWFRYKGTSKIQTLEARKTQKKDWQYIADFITVIFELKYNLE